MNQFETVAWINNRDTLITRQQPVTVCYYVDEDSRPEGVWVCDESGKDVTLDVPMAEYDYLCGKAVDDAMARIAAKSAIRALPTTNTEGEHDEY